MNIDQKLDRAQKTAKTLATICIVSILFTIYTFIKKMESEKLAIQARQELELCKNQK